VNHFVSNLFDLFAMIGSVNYPERKVTMMAVLRMGRIIDTVHTVFLQVRSFFYLGGASRPCDLKDPYSLQGDTTNGTGSVSNVFPCRSSRVPSRILIAILRILRAIFFIWAAMAFFISALTTLFFWVYYGARNELLLCHATIMPQTWMLKRGCEYLN
jgi:hypothetical protein